MPTTTQIIIFVIVLLFVLPFLIASGTVFSVISSGDEASGLVSDLGYDIGNIFEGWS
jgi:hypothetical protein